MVISLVNLIPRSTVDLYRSNWPPHNQMNFVTMRLGKDDVKGANILALALKNHLAS